MGIGNVLGRSILGSNFVKSAVKIVKKNPLLVAGGAGVVGLIGYKAATSSRKQQTDAMNRMLLLNPYTNPLGCWQHVFNPNKEPNALDGPILKYLIDHNNEQCQKYYDNLSLQEKVREYYKNGGKGVNFENVS